MGAPTPPDVSASASDRDVSIPHNKVAFDGEPGSEEDVRASNSTDFIDPRKELYDSTVIDPVLARKMTLVNDAIDQIGMTPFQWKLFFLNGFGYAVDSVSPYGVRWILLFSLTKWSKASYCMPIDRQPGRDARIWKS